MANNLQIYIDLKTPDASRTTVDATIKALGNWARVSPSFWYVRSTYSAAEARNSLVTAVSDGDTVYVVDASTGEAAWRGLSTEVATYVKSKWTQKD